VCVRSRERHPQKNRDYYFTGHREQAESVSYPTTPLECATSSGDGKSSAIAVLTGSLNPVHKDHIEMAHFAIRQLKQQNYFPVKVILSPSHDAYVSTKPGFIPFQHRAAMCELACNFSDDIVCDHWEGSQSHFIDFEHVVRHFAQENENASVFYLCGEDHFDNCVWILQSSSPATNHPCPQQWPGK